MRSWDAGRRAGDPGGIVGVDEAGTVVQDVVGEGPCRGLGADGKIAGSSVMISTSAATAARESTLGRAMWRLQAV